MVLPVLKFLGKNNSTQTHGLQNFKPKTCIASKKRKACIGVIQSEDMHN